MSTSGPSISETFGEFQTAVYALERQLGEERRSTPADLGELFQTGDRISKKLRPVAHLGAMLLPVRAELEPNERGRRLGLLLSNSTEPMYFSELSPAYVCPTEFIVPTDPPSVSNSFALPMEGSVTRFSCGYYDAPPEWWEDSRYSVVNFTIAKYGVDPALDRIEDAPKKEDAADPILVGELLVQYYGDEQQLFVKGEYITAASDVRTAHRELLRATQLVQYGFMAVGS